MESVNIKGNLYKCEIIRSKIKKVYIRYRNDTVVISAPLKMKEKEIINIIIKNEEKIYALINRVNKKKKFTFENGSEIPFYGRNYKIIYSDDEFIRNDFIYLKSSSPKESYFSLARKYGKNFYRWRIDYYNYTYNLDYDVKQIVIRDMKTRYGVCNYRMKKITFQLKLALYPMECIDYIVVHELTHFKVQNHSKAFYDEVKKIMPDYKRINKRLKEIE